MQAIDCSNKSPPKRTGSEASKSILSRVLEKSTIDVCYIVSYHFPHYTRNEALIAALRNLPHVRLHYAVNRRCFGFLRYFESMLNLLAIRIRYDPDVFFLGFRGHEIFWLVKVLTWGRRLIFDELMSPYDSLVHEKGRLKPNGLVAKLLFRAEYSILHSSDSALTDTTENRDYYCNLFGLELSRMRAIPVGADESLFYPKAEQTPSINSKFHVLFYGSFLPLHGIDIIIEAAERVNDTDIRLTLIGGKGSAFDYYSEKIQSRGLKNIQHIKWVPYKRVPDWIRRSDVCLAGSYGATGQAKRVVTGKTFQFLSMGKTGIVPRRYSIWGFQDKRNCVMPSNSSSIALADAIIWCRENRSRLNEIGYEGRRLYLDRFSAEANSKRMDPLLSL